MLTGPPVRQDKKYNNVIYTGVKWLTKTLYLTY